MLSALFGDENVGTHVIVRHHIWIGRQTWTHGRAVPVLIICINIFEIECNESDPSLYILIVAIFFPKFWVNIDGIDYVIFCIEKYRND